MRVLGAVVMLAVLFVLYLVADTVVRDHVETDIAKRIEANVVGSTATVRISSFPFTGHLAVGGDVPTLDATVTGVSVGGVAVRSVDLAVRDLTVDRNQLLHGTVLLRSIQTATARAVITQLALDRGTGLPVTLGAGTIGLDGVHVQARVAVTSDKLDITVAGLRTIVLPLLPSSLLPCTLSGTVTPGAVVLTCTTSTIPPALVQAASAGASSGS